MIMIIAILIMLAGALLALLLVYLKSRIKLKEKQEAIGKKEDELNQVQGLLTQTREELSQTLEILKQKEDELVSASADLEKFKPIKDIETEVAGRGQELSTLTEQLAALQSDFDSKKAILQKDYASKRKVYQALLRELSILQDNLNNVSYGLYQPHYTFETSEKYKREMDANYEKQKGLITRDEATFCPTKWTVDGSEREGERMTKRNAKLMLRAFNGECDSAIVRVSWNNAVNMEARISKAFEAINKLGAVNKISITDPYLKLKLEELHLAYELQEKLHQEREEQRQIREQMREEEKAQEEMEKAKKDAADEEIRYQKALAIARKEMEKATGKQLSELEGHIRELELNLKQAQEKKERAIARAQLTKSGHVYVISNIGSFGENVYKIGMTRRLEPMDRIDELGNASVPFDFDVHAIVFSENVPELEHKFHQRFSDNRVNLLNTRREFFTVSLEDIQLAAKQLGVKMELTKLAEAKEYRATQSMREAKSEKLHTTPKEMEQFPTSLI